MNVFLLGACMCTASEEGQQKKKASHKNFRWAHINVKLLHFFKEFLLNLLFFVNLLGYHTCDQQLLQFITGKIQREDICNQCCVACQISFFSPVSKAMHGFLCRKKIFTHDPPTPSKSVPRLFLGTIVCNLVKDIEKMTRNKT